MEFLTIHKRSSSHLHTKLNGLMDPLSKLFECTVCNSFLKTPVELKCGHTFCKGCLKRGIENVLNVSCPTCKCKTIKRALRERNDINELIPDARKMLKSFSQESKNIGTEETSQTQPLDLSLEKPRELCNTIPKRNCSAIKFIKPLDLTCIQKNKCDPKKPIPNLNDFMEEKSLMKMPKIDNSTSRKGLEIMEIDVNDLKLSKTDSSTNGNDMEIDLTNTSIHDIHENKKVSLEADNSTNDKVKKIDLTNLKMPKEFNLANEKAVEIEIDIKSRNENQTGETCYEVNSEDDGSETSGSELSVLAETPVKETDSKRKSLRDIHSTVTKPCLGIKNSESSMDSEPSIVPLRASTSYINRQNECSEIPTGMFDLSFDKLEEVQQMNGKSKCPTPPQPPNDVLSQASSSQSLLSSRFVFCPTRLSKLQVLQLQKLCDICNGTIVKLYSDEVTHLIINLERGRVPQTVKYLFAIAGKKWVVTFSWVYKCIQEGKMVNEESFETSNFPDCDIGVKKSRLATVPLFKDFNFFIAGDMKSSGATVDECKKLLSQLGGNILVSAGETSENVLIVGDLLDKSRTCEYWYKNRGLLTVSWEWILDCILTFSLVNFSKNHLITNLNGSGLGKAVLPKALLNIRQV